jgi:hypothetical protein
MQRDYLTAKAGYDWEVRNLREMLSLVAESRLNSTTSTYVKPRNNQVLWGF